MGNLAVVTSCWGSYGRFLSDWAGSLVSQTVRPSQAVIVDCGLDDPSNAVEAKRMLVGAGIDTVLALKNDEGMGANMNAAVSLADAEWIIRLDVDDMLFPGTIKNVLRVTKNADVVSMGALKNDETVLFNNVSSEWILDGRQGSLAPSAFRKSFWKKAPFIEMNDWIESAFWVGLAHAGARFVSTGRPGFFYRQHPGSHSHTISPESKRLARLQHLRLCEGWDSNSLYLDPLREQFLVIC